MQTRPRYSTLHATLLGLTAAAVLYFGTGCQQASDLPFKDGKKGATPEAAPAKPSGGSPYDWFRENLLRQPPEAGGTPVPGATAAPTSTPTPVPQVSGVGYVADFGSPEEIGFLGRNWRVDPTRLSGPSHLSLEGLLEMAVGGVIPFSVSEGAKMDGGPANRTFVDYVFNKFQDGYRCVRVTVRNGEVVNLEIFPFKANSTERCLTGATNRGYLTKS